MTERMEEEMKKIVFLSVSIVALFIFTQVNVLACSCPTVEDSSEITGQMRNAEVIFSGEVIGINKIPKTRMIQVKIEVQESWKEVLPEEITITTEIGTCGYDFRVGTEYLVIAHDSNDGTLTTGLCLGNRILYKTAKELKVLGEGNKPQRNKTK